MRPADAFSLLHVGRAIQEEARGLGLAPPTVAQRAPSDDLAGLYDALLTSQPLRAATRQLFIDGHYAEAVEEAYKCVNNTVKKRSGSQRDGTALMFHVLNKDKPVLKLSDLRTSTEVDEQEGYAFIFAGCMLGIRNPRAHTHDLKDEPKAALEMLAWANHLMRVIGRAKRTRQRRAGTLSP